MTAGNGPDGSSLRAGDTFYRAHGLGNDYLVFEAVLPERIGWEVVRTAIRRVCGRGRGVGSDGLVVLTDRRPADGAYPLRMFNPDGSEFERSGNGLRILASHLFREGLVGHTPFQVRCGGSTISMTVHEAGHDGRYDVSVEMGQARVGLEWVGGSAAALDTAGRAVHPALGPVAFVPVSVGNPHAVVFPLSPQQLSLNEVGPFLTGHPAFVRGTNVQVVDVVASDRVRIAIWERGVGRTSASGTSACAVVVAAVATERIPPGTVTVEMEGGTMLVSVTPELDVVLRGPVEEVEEGRLASGFLSQLAEVLGTDPQ